MKVNICDICDKIIGHKQGVTLKASDHTLTRIIDNHVISNMKRKYKVHICDDCIEAIEEYCKAAKAESNTKEVQTKIKGYTKLKMKTCDECRFLKVINHAVNAETMKMLGGILIDANAPNMVELTAYSNDIKIKYYVHADVEQKGTVVCNPKYLMNISKGENKEVIISTDKDNVIEMKIGTYKQKWQGTVAENYPKISMPECNNELMLEQERFREILTKTVPFAAPTVGYRPQYNGVLFDMKNEILHNVSTDGKRMAHITTPVGTYGNMSFVITLPAAKELCRIESENPLLRIVVDNTNMRLLLDYSEFIVVASTFNENGYVKYDNMMNRESDITATVKRAEFMQMIERGKFVSEQGKTKVPVTLELKDDVLKCNGRNLRCQLKDEIDATKIAGNIKIGFNADFLMDMIKTIRSDNVVLELKTQKDALIIKDGDTELLLLPVIV